MDIRTVFSGLGRRRAATPAITPAAFVSSTLTSVTLLSVLLFSCEEVKPDLDENRSAVSTVHGTVRSSVTGGPLSGATVTLMRDGELVETAETAVDGSYSFTGVEAGAGYTVTAAASIYTESAAAAFNVSENHVQDITLDRRWPSEGTVVTASVYVNGIAAAPDGTIYIAVYGADKIQTIAPDGTVSEYAGTGGEGVDDGSLAAATFSYPEGIAVSADGTRVYVTDNSGHRVRHITGGQVFTIAGTGRSPGFSGDGGNAKLAVLNYPQGVAVDAAGNVYVADNGNQVIRRISAADGTISRIAGGGGETQDNGNALSAELYSPRGIAVDIQGNVYITEAHRVRKITPAGAISTVIGNIDAGPNLPQLYWPQDIAVDAAGTMYVADYENHRIVKVTADGTASALAGSGQGSDNGQFNHPTYLAIGPEGALYIVDSGNRRIMKY